MALGASSFIAPEDDPTAAAIEELGGQPDVVFEAAGVLGTIERAMQIVWATGTVLVLGWCAVPDSFVPAIYMMKQIRLQFSMTYGVGDFQHVIDTLDASAVEARTMVSDTVSLDELRPC